MNPASPVFHYIYLILLIVSCTARRARNPFRSLSANPFSSPAPMDDSVESDCFVPKTPEKLDFDSHSEDFIIPSTPDDSK